jgi:hypothetical protein
MLRIIDKLLSIMMPVLENGDPNNDNQQPHDASNGIEVPKNILAFRTITAILNEIPRSKPIEVIDNLESNIMNTQDCQSIKISDAFAHLAAGEHDVVALVTNHWHTSSIRDHDGTELSVLACTDNLIGETLLPQAITSTPANLIAKLKVWCLMITRNFRWSDPETSSGFPHPTIISSSEPDNLGGKDVFDYMVELERDW